MPRMQAGRELLRSAALGVSENPGRKYAERKGPRVCSEASVPASVWIDRVKLRVSYFLLNSRN